MGLRRGAAAPAGQRRRRGRRPGGRRPARLAGRTPSWSARSATRRSTTPPPPPRFNTAGWYDHTGAAHPGALRLRGQRPRHQRPLPRGLGRGDAAVQPGMRYFGADGADPAPTYDGGGRGGAWVRRHRRPAVLHLRTVRLMGHAGADAEPAYRSAGEIAADLARDPVVATARLLVEAGLATAEELLARYDETRLAGAPDRRGGARRAEAGLRGRDRRPAGAAPPGAGRPGGRRRGGPGPPGPGAGARAEAFGGKPPEKAGPLTLAQSINAALTDAMLDHPQMTVFGEDVAAKGGVYGVTKGLRDRFGAARVFDTLLDETSILGLGLGAGLAGMLPVPEIQYLAYLHNAEDQLRGEAATMQFFSAGGVPQPDGGAGGRAGLPGGVRRALPQRQLGRRTAGHPRPGGRGAGAAGRRRADAADLPGRGGGRRQRLRVPGADRALPHPRPVRRGRRRVAGRLRRAGRLGGRRTCRSAGPGCTASARPTT